MLFQRHQIAGDVFRILRRQPQTGHHGHVLHLQLVSIVRAPAVFQVKNIGQTLLFVIFGTDVLLFVGAVGTRALTRVVNPTHQIVVAVLLTHAGKIRGEGSALQLVALADGVTCQAATRFKQLLAVSRVSRFVLGQGIRQRRLPHVRGDGFDLFIVEPEIRHLG